MKPKSIFLLIWGTLLSFTSCYDHDNVYSVRGSEGGGIMFNVDIVQPWDGAGQSATRAPKIDTPVRLELTDKVEGVTMRVNAYEGIYEKTPMAGADGTRLHTRAMPINSLGDYLDLSYQNKFGLSAYVYRGSDWTDAPESSPNFISNLEINYLSASGSYKPMNQGKGYLWPPTNSDYKMSFFAYAPCGHPSLKLSESGSPKLHYTVPSTVSGQTDVVTASTRNLAVTSTMDDASFKQPLTFHHRLAAIKFKVDDRTNKGIISGTVNKVALNNVYGEGDYDFWTQSWTVEGEKMTFQQNPNYVADPLNNNLDITADEKTFLMIPQALPADAEVELVINHNGTNVKFTANIGGRTWEQGKTYVYTLTTEDELKYNLNVSPPASYVYSGGTNNFSISSWQYVSAGVPGALAWQTEFSEDDGNTWSTTPPSWVHMPTSGSGSADKTTITYQIHVDAQTNQAAGHTNFSHTTVLSGHPFRGSEDYPYDLSTHDLEGNQTAMNTANCYVINAAGTYMIPLVYGNAIKNGDYNERAYKSDLKKSDGVPVLETFVNHLDRPIINPYIYNNRDASGNALTATSAALLWQDDAGGQVSISTENRNGLTRDKHYIVFSVGKSATIKEGNAVVAVKDASGKIMWSWHLWITDQNIYSTIPIHSRPTYAPSVVKRNNASGEDIKSTISVIPGNRYLLMPAMLGWTNNSDAVTDYYSARSVIVRISAANGSASSSFVLKQNEHIVSNNILGSNIYYQWGRKDPIPGSADNGSNVEKTIYDANGSPFTMPSGHIVKTTTVNEGRKTIGWSIQNPDVFIVTQNDGDWACNTDGTANRAANKWNTNNNLYTINNNPVIKTVYDPSPVGFHVAPTNAFTGTTSTGHSTSGLTSRMSMQNISEDWNGGAHFYCDYSDYPEKSNYSFYLPNSCYRAWSTGNLGAFTDAYSWLAGPYNPNGNSFFFQSTIMNSTYTSPIDGQTHNTTYTSPYGPSNGPYGPEVYTENWDPSDSSKNTSYYDNRHGNGSMSFGLPVICVYEPDN